MEYAMARHDRYPENCCLPPHLSPNYFMMPEFEGKEEKAVGRKPFIQQWI